MRNIYTRYGTAAIMTEVEPVLSQGYQVDYPGDDADNVSGGCGFLGGGDDGNYWLSALGLAVIVVLAILLIMAFWRREKHHHRREVRAVPATWTGSYPRYRSPRRTVVYPRGSRYGVW